jgi:hypothetical protein
MRVEMIYGRVWQDAGRGKSLNIGESHDLPDVVALALVATGAAKRTADAPPLEDAPKPQRAGKGGR